MCEQTLKIFAMKKGRRLEIILERISHLAIPNAKIESPCIVKDIDTGEAREVDVGVKISSDSREIFIAIECRDRKAIQDVTWIEQLISKKESIGADRLIAVTSSRFSDNARIKAQKKGIELENISRLDVSKILSFCHDTYVETLGFESRVTSLELKLSTNNLDVNVSEDSVFFDKTINQEISSEQFLEALSQSFLNQIILGKPKDNICFSDYFNQYYSELEKAARKHLENSEGLESDHYSLNSKSKKPKIRIWTDVKFDLQHFMIVVPKNLYLIRPKQYLDIQDMKMRVEISRKIRKFPLSAIYSSEKIDLLEHNIRSGNSNSESIGLDIVVDKESKEAQWWICWSDIQEAFPNEYLVQILFANQTPIKLKSLFLK